MGIADSVDAVAQIFHVEVNDVAQFAASEYEVGIELLLKEFAILGDALQFEDNLAIDDEVEAQVIL